jgi:hypothetical protein
MRYRVHHLLQRPARSTRYPNLYVNASYILLPMHLSVYPKLSHSMSSLPVQYHPRRLSYFATGVAPSQTLNTHILRDIPGG